MVLVDYHGWSIVQYRVVSFRNVWFRKWLTDYLVRAVDQMIGRLSKLDRSGPQSRKS